MTTIVCGTDFSACAQEASRVAASIAKRRGVPLVLAHAADGEAARGAAAQRLEEQAQSLREWCVVTTETPSTPADDGLLAVAGAHAASLVVVGAVGERKGAWWLGSTAERVARAAAVPVLVVRTATTLWAWLAGEHRLRVFVAVDDAGRAGPMARWVASLGELGPIDPVLAHLSWPPQEQAELGLQAPLNLEHPHPKVLAAREEELGRLAAEQLPGQEVSRIVRVGWGRPADHLLGLAEEQRADLVVVGGRRRSALDRLWRGSVTHGLLWGARCNVACVPLE